MSGSLSRDRVLVEGLALADEHGLGRLSMQLVARNLGVATMSLYTYVTNKADLLGGVAAMVLRRIDVPPADVGWQEGFRAVAQSVRAVTRRHPEVIALMLDRGPSTIGASEPLEALLTVMRRAGFGERDAALAARLLWSLTGLVMAEQHSGPFGRPNGLDDLVAFTARLPSITRLAPLLYGTPVVDFDDAVELVIDSLDRRLSRGSG